MKVKVIASGSTGNSYLVFTDTTHILLEAGVSHHKILTHVNAKDINAILVSHEHSDHVIGLQAVMNKATNATLYLSKGTYEGLKFQPDPARTMIIDSPIQVGDMKIEKYHLSHDANEAIGFKITDSEGKMLSLITDTGYVTDETYFATRNSDMFILETNYDEELIWEDDDSPYGYHLRKRIDSDWGHLSNKQAAEFIVSVLDVTDKKPKFLLGHISKSNNTTERILTTLRQELFKKNYFIGVNLMAQTLEYGEGNTYKI